MEKVQLIPVGVRAAGPREIGMLLNSWLLSELDENTLVGNCLMFLTEGSETSAITLTYTVYELARNPTVQQKLFEEVSSCGELNQESISTMKYLDQVITGECGSDDGELLGSCHPETDLWPLHFRNASDALHGVFHY